MNFLFAKSILLILLTFLASNCSSVALSSQIISNNNTQIKEQNSKESDDYLEPKLSGLDSDRYTQQIQKAWQKFSGNGQYRLAGKEDMKFSQATIQKAKELEKQVDYLFRPFIYAWGNLGYPMKKSQDHLAAIVVDNTKTDGNKFSLIIFSPPQGNSNEYQLYWLYKDVDLSNVSLEAPSGYLIIRKYSTDGIQTGCFIKWNNKLKNFQCK